MYKKKLHLGIAFTIAMVFGLLFGINKAIARHFVKNVGQVTDQHFNHRSDIDFKLTAAGGLNIFIGSGAVHYQFVNVSADESQSAPVNMYRLDVELLGANPNAKIITEGQNATYERYYTNGLEGAVAHKYSKITYKDIYPHIDWVFYFTKNGLLEYDFVVHPGGEVNNIKMRYDGADDLKLNKDGSLTATTPMGVVTENAPIAYQQKNKVPVPSSFRLDGNILSFSAAGYTGTLVIDPVLEWGTYFGDVSDDRAWDIKTGKYGDVFVTGRTNSLTNIATLGAHQTVFGEGTTNVFMDAFLARFDIDGDLLWATYYGGEDNEQAMSVACDTAGNAYISGYTFSNNNIASTGAFQTSKAGSWDAYLAKFDTSGTRLWGTFYGGTSSEGSQFMGLVCDGESNVYITGNTSSISDIATSGAFQDTYDAGGDMFLAKFSASGNLVWATYLGGSGQDFGCNVAVDAWNHIYVTGYTTSTNAIATTGTQQQTLAGSADAFVIKLDSDGDRLWGTYFGGPTVDRGYSIVCDDSGNVYIGGLTNSVSGIATTGSHQASIGGGQDGFLSRFDSLGILDWSTYFGGSANDNIYTNSITYGANGDLYITGTTQSTAGITFGGVLNTAIGGLTDGFVARFTTSGDLVWGGYYGAAGNDNAISITADNIGNLYFGGYTNSPVSIATTGSYQVAFAGGANDAFLVRLNDCEAPDAPLAITGDVTICSNDTVVYSTSPVMGVDEYLWLLPNGWQGNSDSASIMVTPNGGSGGDVQVASVNYCTTSDTISISVTVNPAPEPQISRNANVLSTTQSFSSYQWNKDGQAIAGAMASTYVVTENGSYTVTVTGTNGCAGTSGIEEITHLSLTGLNAATFTVYPNPAKDVVTININMNAVAKLVDVTGRSLMTNKLNNGSNDLGISHLQNGMYIIRIFSNDGSYMGEAKLVKAAQ